MFRWNLLLGGNYCFFFSELSGKFNSGAYRSVIIPILIKLKQRFVKFLKNCSSYKNLYITNSSQEIMWRWNLFWIFFDMKMAVFWVVALCSLEEVYQRLGGTWCLHHRPDDGGSKDLWNVGKLLPGYTALQPRLSHLRTQRRENLKSYLIFRYYKY
jgi:hypothetical protein